MSRVSWFDSSLEACLRLRRSREDLYGFDGDFAFLATTWSSTVFLGDVAFPSVENAYHASKALDNCDFVTMMAEVGPRRASSLAAPIDRILPPSWGAEVGLGVMRHLNVQKFFLHGRLGLLLASTRGCLLYDDRRCAGSYWGVDPVEGDGANVLGDMLAEIREMVLDVMRVEDGRPGPEARAVSPDSRCPLCGAASDDHPSPRGRDDLARRCDGFVVLRPRVRA